MPQRPWPALGLGWVLAVLVLLGCLAAAFTDVHVVNLALWLVGLLALAVIIG